MKISIIITVYQAEKYISNCINSIQNQTYSNFEVIIINDGSTDKSLEIIEQYALKDDRITIISQENKGLVASRRVGLNAAKNDFVFYIDADDTLPPNALELLVYNYKNNVDIVVGNMNICSEDGQTIRIHANELLPLDTKQDIMFALLTKKLSASLCGKLIRKKILLSVSTNLQYTIGEDVVTNMLIIDKFNVKINAFDEISYNYIQHNGSMLNSIGHQTAIKRLQYIEKIYNICSKYIENKKVKDGLSYFMLEEFYSFLRDGGNLTDNTRITYIVYNDSLNNEWAKKQLKSWRYLLLILNHSYPCLGQFMRQCLLLMRRIKSR